MRNLFYSGLIRLHILHHAAEEPIFGLWIIDELQRHGYRVGPGTIYPMLSGLERAGYLRSSRTKDEGRQRRVYTATPSGKRALAEARAKVQELFGELFEGTVPGDSRAVIPSAQEIASMAARPVSAFLFAKRLETWRRELVGDGSQRKRSGPPGAKLRELTLRLRQLWRRIDAHRHEDTHYDEVFRMISGIEPSNARGRPRRSRH